MDLQKLAETAHTLVGGRKGILAADESTGTMTKRLESVGVESTEEARRAYRDMLVTTPGLSEFISGVILYDEQFWARTNDGSPFPETVARQGLIPGIKVDTGAKPLALSPQEKVTEGLDGLRERLEDHVGAGARFTKWRAVVKIDDEQRLPSRDCIHVNAHALARFAALSQDTGLVPIVEPEILMAGDHTLERDEEVTAEVLRRVFAELAEQRVQLEGMVLKTNMIIPGEDCPEQASVEQVAEATVRCLRRTVPAAVPGIAFLSGGQSPELATQHLNAMSALRGVPWELSFSFGRALVGPPLRAWKGDEANVEAGQAALHHRGRMNAAARAGSYEPAMESV
jgi:fructose-bisphosphate aldolase, class I